MYKIITRPPCATCQLCYFPYDQNLRIFRVPKMKLWLIRSTIFFYCVCKITNANAIYNCDFYSVNVALNKNATTTSGIHIGRTDGKAWNPSGAVDGDRTQDGADSCFSATRSPSDWKVDLGQEYQLYHITVYFRRNCKCSPMWQYIVLYRTAVYYPYCLK